MGFDLTLELSKQRRFAMHDPAVDASMMTKGNYKAIITDMLDLSSKSNKIK